ncbi:MAG: glutamine-hydrolyzing carbamoyl-phosphate synthase small subunit [Magnetococcales bacterium]|nr:glutamine-hydrolyzing carbamoyl-phosphate synthase small subunit [Magnetococcales bacterium]MBF0631780.1 glutamine-hydrolyzing carbamoyl-phosphate synthase small subunit [Magnetococcales bacterium]
MIHGVDKAVLVLDDGTRFDGIACGAEGESVGEVCFNTSMSGYQEIMSDPSYAGQIVTMTSPQIGNVGINPEDMESRRPWFKGFVLRESSRIPSNWRAKEDLSGFLARHGIPAIEGIDTRALVGWLRDHGSRRGVLSTTDFDTASLVAKARAWPGLAGMDLTGEVTCERSYLWRDGLTSWKHNVWRPRGPAMPQEGSAPFRVAVLDFGVKHNILRNLVSAGCSLEVWPARVAPEQLLGGDWDGFFLSNGPGDPEAVKHGIMLIEKLLHTGRPIFGICLGHQMLALALGARTTKMKFGHRGGNHPVKNIKTGLVEITSQNHGFVVARDSLPAEVTVTHESLFDGSIEGIRHNRLPVFSVQYHPEASPGPHDAHYLFGDFVTMMRHARHS